MFKLLVLIAVVPAILARTPIRSCGGGLPMPTAAFLNSRENPCLAEPCQMSRSSGVGVTYVDFTPPFATPTIMPRVRATVFGNIEFNQELPPEVLANPCGILTQGSCPLPANVPASYRLAIPIDQTVPLIPTDTEITLFGSDNRVIFCYRLHTTLVA